MDTVQTLGLYRVLRTQGGTPPSNGIHSVGKEASGEGSGEGQKVSLPVFLRIWNNVMEPARFRAIQEKDFPTGERTEWQRAVRSRRGCNYPARASSYRERS